ncbi:MICOS complex subunit MIC25 [Anthophora retusa]
MGSGQSARRLTIDNEDTSVVGISDSVVERLTQTHEGGASEPKKKEQELRTQDTYWQKRLQNLEKKHAKINEIIDTEYKKAAEQLYTNGKGSVNIQDTVQPCKSSSDKVYECYQVNPKEILKCSNVVEEFYDCVDQRRARVIAARC